MYALGMMGIWATTGKQLQLDPPEAALLSSKRGTIAFIGKGSFQDYSLFEGVIQTIMLDIVKNFKDEII